MKYPYAVKHGGKWYAPNTEIPEAVAEIEATEAEMPEAVAETKPKRAARR